VAALTVLMAFVVTLAMSGTAVAKKEKTVWLCKPKMQSDPCEASREATVVSYAGNERKEAVIKPGKVKPPPIDCFYVYPTVSEQEGPNANLTIEPQETQVAIDQASRFSQVCKVYAPMYPQLTLKAIKGTIPPEAGVKAFAGVLGAFDEYMAKYNKGRGVVLIGHSQGSIMLENLIAAEFDKSAALRSQLVSAIILGGNVLVPEGQLEGVTFQNEPLCTSAADTGCVIAYSTFLKEPPEDSFFGRPTSGLLGGSPPPGTEVACVNPTVLVQNGGTGTLLPYAPTTPFPGENGGGVPTPTATTPWVQTNGVYQAQCKHENGATWLQPSFGASVTTAAREDLLAHNEVVEELIGPEWGLHLYDVNIALGNLVALAGLQSVSYEVSH
jgi:Protein of unknown function (DUF3089)